MKKFVLALTAAAALTLASCSTVGPLCATSNSVGSKVGESKATFLFGYLPFGESDAGIQAAAKKGGISKISTVDVKTTIGFLTVTKTTIVTGE